MKLSSCLQVPQACRSNILAVLSAWGFVAVGGVAQAAVYYSGDVKPSSPVGFGVPVGQPGVDDDGDNIADWIDADGGGNNVFSNLADPNDPTGNGGNGLAWDDALVWVDYDTPQNILVGDNGYGSLEITTGSALRYQHLVLGGKSDASSSGYVLSLSTVGNSDDYNYLSDVLNHSSSLPAAGYGVVLVSGVGSVFNNDPNVIPAQFQAALNFAHGFAPTSPVTSLEGLVNGDASVRPIAGNSGSGNDTYDVHVGLLSGGELRVEAGGRVEIQDALQVGTAQNSNGRVEVRGAGSYLVASGRSELANDGRVASTFDETSYVGGRGRGVLNVRDGGRAEFRNGLSIGAPTGRVDSATSSGGLGKGDGSGLLVVSGPGAVAQVFSSAVPSFEASDIQGSLPVALAIGDIRPGALASDFDPIGNASDRLLQPGELQIADRGEVRVSFAPSYGSTAQEGNAIVGRLGSVKLANGSLVVSDKLLHDGSIRGYGSLYAGTMETSRYAEIAGGVSETAASGLLRIVLNGDATGQLNGPTLINRGHIAGAVQLEVVGQIQNEGTIQLDNGLVADSIVNEGLLSVEAQQSGVDLNGDYTQSEIGQTEFRIDSDFVDGGHALRVSGTASLDGSIAVEWPTRSDFAEVEPIFQPSDGDFFDVLVASSIIDMGIELISYDAAAGVTSLTSEIVDLSPGQQALRLTVSVGSGELTGDYNNDLTVNAADYVVWRDGNSPDSSIAGFEAWASNYGADSIGATQSTSSVPEPASLGMLACGLVIALPHRVFPREHGLPNG